MAAFYNENDPFAAAWLRELIAAGHIAPGVVDERSIEDLSPSDLNGFEQCHFFAGVAGWSRALRLAGWPDARSVWTGSCPCQPFSQAGKREGFADDRHLWPAWVRLIGERKPSVVFGEQVASATEWLRLVRGDLEALGYAVGAIPIEAASAGADHLRDRFWFVADRESERSNRSESATWSQGGSVAESTGGFGLAYADNTRPQGRAAERERAGQRTVGPDGVAYADESFSSDEREQRGREQLWSRRDQISRNSGNMADSYSGGERGQLGKESGAQSQGESQVEGQDGERIRLLDSGAYEWAIGADGKARRVKPGVRLLVNGFPGRVGLLRGFGNAIDPRPASAFIEAWLDVRAA